MRRRLFLLMTAGLAPAFSRAATEPPVETVLREHRHRERQWTACQLDPVKHRMDLFMSGEAGPLRTFAALEHHVTRQGRRVVLAMNGGMFEWDGSPVGWCVAGGREIRKPNLDPGHGNFFLKPNGVFAVLENSALVMETAAAARDPRLRQARLVTQSGPLLVAGGRIHEAFNAGSVNRRIRNGVGVTAEGKVWWALSGDEVNFHESATYFRDELGCPDALFLDGQISRLHAPALGRSGGHSPLGPLLAVTEAISQRP